MSVKIQKYLLSALLTVSLVVVSVPTYAQTINAEGAAKLKTIFESMLEQKKKEVSAEAERPRELILEGDVVVEELDTYYAITLPSMSLSYDNGRKTDLGILALNAVPLKDEGQYKMTFAVPSPIINYDINGEERTRFSIGGQKAAGIWNEQIHGFQKLNVTLTDTLVSAATDGSSVIIPEMKILYDLNADGDRWTGPMRFEANSLKVENPEENLSINLGSMLMMMTMDQLTTDGLANLNADNPEAITDMKVADGIDIRFMLKNLSGSKNKDDGTVENFALGNATFGIKVDDVLSGSALFGLNFGFDGLSSNMMDGEADALFPKSSSFKITQKNIPVDALTEVIKNTPADNPQMLGLTMMLKVPAILAQAGSYVEVNETHMRNQNYDVVLDTVLRADIEAANAATAEGQLRFAGLDKVLSLVQVAASSSEDSKQRQTMRNLARFLENLKPYGRSEPDATHGFAHIFDLELNKAGQFMINGKNAMGLMMGGAPPQGQPSQPAGSQSSPL